MFLKFCTKVSNMPNAQKCQIFHQKWKGYKKRAQFSMKSFVRQAIYLSNIHMIELRYTTYSLNNWRLLSIYCSRLLLIDPRSPILLSWDLAVCSSADILELHILHPFRLHEAYLVHEPRGHNLQEPRQDHNWLTSAYSSRGSECIAIFPWGGTSPKCQHLWMLSKALSHSHTLHNVQLLVSRHTPRGTWITLCYRLCSTSWILCPLIITL